LYLYGFASLREENERVLMQTSANSFLSSAINMGVGRENYPWELQFLTTVMARQGFDLERTLRCHNTPGCTRMMGVPERVGGGEIVGLLHKSPY
jgi:hypothetical protein